MKIEKQIPKGLHDAIIKRIADSFDTPLIVYSKAQIYDNINLLKAALPAPVELIYSLKANPNPSIAKIMIDNGLLIETASGGELAHVLHFGIEPQKILFGGPAKREDGIMLALNAEILAFNAESELDLLRIKNCALKNGKIANILIRVNPDIESTNAVLKMGGGASPFGVDEELISCLIDICKQRIQYSGLFMYAGSQYFNAESIVNNSKHLIKVAKKLRKNGKPPVSFLDFGGGFGVPEDSSQPPLDLKKLYNGLSVMFAEELPNLMQDGLQRIFFESGRFLTATSGIFVTRVMDIKKSRGTRFLIVDGGINNLGIKQLPYRTFEPNVTFCGESKNQKQEFSVIVGPTCTPIDIVHSGIKLPEVNVGDLLIIRNCGAYSISYSPINFCGHPNPAEVLVIEDGSYFLIRKRGSLKSACGIGYIKPSVK